MAVSISSLVVRLTGTVASDVTAIEIDGAAVTIDPDRTWNHQVAVPVTGAIRHVAVTAIAPDRTETRLVAVERMPTAPSGIG
ncbi:MAG TPA: hypothetical protein VEL07_01880 [Planctomycetota bacterium]|nr:hypothetical protein [Planctomycetota bacterium]